MGHAQEMRILDEIRTGVQTYKTLGVRRAAYGSTAITGGLDLLNAYRTYGVSSVKALDEIDPAIYRGVVQGNIAKGGVFCDKLRRRYPLVIDPSEFFRRGWAQKHYLSFWEQVIKLYGDPIVFNAPLQYSAGQSFELYLGVSLGREVLHPEGRIVAPRDELKRIEDAIGEYELVGADVTALSDVYRNLSLLLDGQDIVQEYADRHARIVAPTPTQAADLGRH